MECTLPGNAAMNGANQFVACGCCNWTRLRPLQSFVVTVSVRTLQYAECRRMGSRSPRIPAFTMDGSWRACAQHRLEFVWTLRSAALSTAGDSTTIRVIWLPCRRRASAHLDTRFTPDPQLRRPTTRSEWADVRSIPGPRHHACSSLHLIF